jgi:hypothetical protein
MLEIAILDDPAIVFLSDGVMIRDAASDGPTAKRQALKTKGKRPVIGGESRTEVNTLCDMAAKHCEMSLRARCLRGRIGLSDMASDEKGQAFTGSHFDSKSAEPLIPFVSF